jgi:hypothetical protein
MPRRAQVHPNSRTSSSAAAMCGVIGLPDPGMGPRLHDGGLRAFCETFNDRFDAKAEADRPEWRSFARAEREARAI